MTSVLVVCVGNRLVGDDGVGPAVFDALTDFPLPENVSLTLLETRGIGLLDELDGQSLLAVVDAVRFGTPPGTLHVLNGEELASAARMPVTSHDIALTEALAVGERLFPERMPSEVIFIGVEGKEFSLLGASLSPEVEAAVPRVIETLTARLPR